MGKILFGGQIVERSEVHIDIEDRGYQFGDGVYEVIRVYNGQLFTAKEHISRLFQSAEKIKMTIPITSEKLQELVNTLIVENNVENGSVYIQVTRGTAPRSHMFPSPSEKAKGVITAYTNEVARPEDALKNGVKAISTDDIRWLRCDIKSLNLLPNVLAKQEAVEAGCFEAILHRSGTVTEGSSSNVYIVKDNQVCTHPADNLILNGITRQVLVKLCKENDISIVEKAFEVTDLLQADEVFITSTTSEVMPITMVDGKEIGIGAPGELTRRLQALFTENIHSDMNVKN